MTAGTPEPDAGLVASAADVRARLDAFARRRGYLMAHQGVLAAALPELQDAYGVFYRALTLDQHHLAPLEREFVWLALLTAAGEHIGTHHVDLFFRSGGTERQAEAAFRLVAWVTGATTFEFLAAHWQRYFPAVEAHASYCAGVDALLGDFAEVGRTWARLALLGVATARRMRWAIDAELLACYAEAVPETKMAEAMSLALWPCGVNCFIDAAQVWLELIRSGRVAASEAFRAWAETPGQDGFVLSPRPLPPA